MYGFLLFQIELWIFRGYPVEIVLKLPRMCCPLVPFSVAAGQCRLMQTACVGREFNMDTQDGPSELIFGSLKTFIGSEGGYRLQ